MNSEIFIACLDKELIEKRKSEKFERQDQKKTPGKTPAGKGKTPQKNATPQGKFQKNEVKQVTSNKDKQSKENIKPSPKTPTVNGDQVSTMHVGKVLMLFIWG